MNIVKPINLSKLFELLFFESKKTDGQRLVELLKNKIPLFMSNVNGYCEEKLGSGFFGDVVSNTISGSVEVEIKNKKIPMDVAIKKIRSQTGTFDVIKHEDNIIVYSDNELSCEAIFFMLVSELWIREITPHVPYLIGAGKCDTVSNSNHIDTAQNISPLKPDTLLINRFVIERHGLLKSITIHNKGINPFINDVPRITKTYLNNLMDLMKYVCLNRRHNKALLPNNIQCDIVELLDGYFISFLHTAHLLWKNYKITLLDQHSRNIFIHWIDKQTYMGTKPLNNIKYIYYKLTNSKNKYIRIPTFGTLLKIGDLGSCISNPVNNLFIVGDLPQVDDSLKHIHKYKTQLPMYIDFMLNINFGLPTDIYDQTIIGKIFHQELFKDLVIYDGYMSNVDKYPSPYDLLLYNPVFDKYRVNSIIDKKNVLII
ncbi:MAG: hypothetical protein Terrestrivirus4_205 [Terrestrivirus sp.]|uniref:Uncharacterized protein n=1 Tax=Terrestrivirus sp. TaxID=2487775 RepID=A0A3G4ZMT4_9VIRU|nr:MAG: hypothetical protein Terrestrivirus4_205 [Terrestrivirus sp.]